MNDERSPLEYLETEAKTEDPRPRWRVDAQYALFYVIFFGLVTIVAMFGLIAE